MINGHVLYVRADFAAEFERERLTGEEYRNPILDRNGDVVLAQCKRCGRGEIELDTPCDREMG